MSFSNPPLIRCAATPLTTVLQVKLVDYIDQGATYEELLSTILKMAEGLRGQNVVDVGTRDPGPTLLRSPPRVAIIENRKLIENLETYALAVEASEKYDDQYGGKSSDLDDPDDVPTSSPTQTSEIDESTLKWPTPKFAGSGKKKSHSIRAMIRMLKNRNTPTAAPNERSIQRL
ncbi:hypothetical protein F5Y04DRAFT_283566 [Hypomontagnella monticulosa]|nr:hypothetical protein F5Y04DRAFT_283566 [Hypomontagnella monticulosa]